LLGVVGQESRADTNDSVNGHERHVNARPAGSRVHEFFIHVPERLQATPLASINTPRDGLRMRSCPTTRFPYGPLEHRLSLQLCDLRSRDRWADGLPSRAFVLLFRLCSQWTLQLFL
jgi:hypothetical protein